jgi:hypothetical protein
MQNVPAAFITAAEKKKRWLSHNVKISWEKTFDAGIGFAIVGTSVVDGTDIIQGESTVVTQPDLYEYEDESTNVIQWEVERQVYEPIGSIGYANGTIILQNADGRYDPDGVSPLAPFLVPRRPVKIFGGFKYGGISKSIPLMYGLSKAPENDGRSRTIVQVDDYMTYIQNFELNSETAYENQRTDEIIASILDQAGFDPSQYDLDRGLNTLNFAYFNKGDKAGEQIRKLCEAEEGYFFQDEFGILRFSNRAAYKQTPLNSSVLILTESMVLENKELKSSKILNKCRVVAKPRTLQSQTEVWSQSEKQTINPGEVAIVWANFENPSTDIQDIDKTSSRDDDLDIIASSDKNDNGTRLNSSVVVSVIKYVTSARISITNGSGVTMYITKLRLRGRPAVAGSIEVIVNNTTSQDIYDIGLLEIDNDFIQTKDFARYLARSVVTKYGDPRRRRQLKIRALPHLQLKDMITVTTNGNNVEYRVLKIETDMMAGAFNQLLTVREVTDDEANTLAIVGTSLVDGTHVII